MRSPLNRHLNDDGSPGLRESKHIIYIYTPYNFAARVLIPLSLPPFKTDVLQSTIPVVLDCYADWCNPCKQLTPILEKSVKKTGGKVALAVLNVDEQPELAEKLGVRSLPTVFGVYQGRLVDQFTGFSDGAPLEAFIGKLVAAASKDGGSEGGIDDDAEPPTLLEQASALLEGGDAEGAASIYKKVSFAQGSNHHLTCLTHGFFSQMHCTV